MIIPVAPGVRPFVPRPRPIRADARERDEGTRDRDEARDNRRALMGWRTLGAMGSRSVILGGSGW
jgi:hypothetical protein